MDPADEDLLVENVGDGVGVFVGADSQRQVG